MNTSGAFKARKAGDTRTEFAAVLNSISSLLILGAIFFGAFLRHLQRENYQTKMMRKELKKVDEYKENMYFEAVQDILTKVNDPKTKGSTKVRLSPCLPKYLPRKILFIAACHQQNYAHYQIVAQSELFLRRLFAKSSELILICCATYLSYYSFSKLGEFTETIEGSRPRRFHSKVPSRRRETGYLAHNKQKAEAKREERSRTNARQIYEEKDITTRTNIIRLQR